MATKADVEPIVITPGQLVALAQRLVDAHDYPWEFTPEQLLAATRHWLMRVIQALVREPEYAVFGPGRAGLPRFDEHSNCVEPGCATPALANDFLCARHREWANESPNAYPWYQLLPEADALVVPPAPDYEEAEDGKG